MPWHERVQTDFDFDDVPEGIRNKVNEIAEDRGRGRLKGTCTLADVTCHHWKAGKSDRIFGAMAGGMDADFHFVGYGPHTSRGKSTYSVTLASKSGTTRVTLT